MLDATEARIITGCSILKKKIEEELEKERKAKEAIVYATQECIRNAEHEIYGIEACAKNGRDQARFNYPTSAYLTRGNVEKIILEIFNPRGYEVKFFDSCFWVCW